MLAAARMAIAKNLAVFILKSSIATGKKNFG
jgi:hypothetical protein